MYTIVCAAMRGDTTSEQIYAEFLTARTALIQQGWEPHGEIMYYINAVSQAMTKDGFDSVEIARHQQYGSTQPRILEYRFGHEFKT